MLHCMSTWVTASRGPIVLLSLRDRAFTQQAARLIEVGDGSWRLPLTSREIYVYMYIYLSPSQRTVYAIWTS